MRHPINIDIYCINIPGEIKRRAHMLQQAQNVGCQLIFTSGVTPRDFDHHAQQLTFPVSYDKVKREHIYSSAINETEKACIVSHAIALQRFLTSEQPYCLVLEDNSELNPRLCDLLHKQALDQLDFDLLKVQNGNYKCKFYFKIAKIENHQIIATPCTTSGAVGIIYSRLGAQKLTAQLNGYFRPFDTLIGYGWSYNLNVLALEKNMVERAQYIPSVIGTDKNISVNKTRRIKKPYTSIAHWARSLLDRNTHGLMKIIHSLRLYLNHKSL